MGLSEATVAQLFVLLDQEIKKQVNAKITKYVEYVSKRYDISLRLLLQDLESIDDLVVEKNNGSCSEGQCLGMRTGNQRCKLKGRFGGYCRWHQDQKKRKTIVVSEKPKEDEEKPLEHNHTIPPLFSANCPACQRTSSKPKKLLIDM